MTFNGRTVVITGAAAGIGYALCDAFAGAGANVVLNDLNENLATRAALELSEKHGAEVIPFMGDIADIEVSRRLIERARERFGGPHVVIANAGVTVFSAFLETTPEDLERVTNVNLRGAYFTAQHAARSMIEQGVAGRILLMSSNVGERALVNLSAYSMTKAGIGMLARSLALELGPHNITVNALAPGPTLTARTEKESPDYAEAWASLLPTRRIGRPEDVAAAALFLASDAAGQISGVTLLVDGGWSAGGAAPA